MAEVPAAAAVVLAADPAAVLAAVEPLEAPEADTPTQEVLVPATTPTGLE